ncbi:NAD(P)H-dependent oxidoreductase [Virgibacillus sp. NKC19-16]|uniref:NADPH-dependent FMN reductase n=1 Tax=Virgibacillus salidurans TaxID=2831673 RepID=UPI001F30135F|nr:NAD(P)H-dependent oxidoreductase [Virgibacillus sp. NKC19-16]UJL46664.1 NAD(P)H-dependent oxidoreductase [Virgibacillus sp. NKC19-16]
MKLVGVSGAPAGEKTSLAVHDVLVAAQHLDSTIQTELIDIREYEIEFSVGAALSDYNDDTWNVVNKISSADFLVFGTPIYQASISGALKNLLDFFPDNAFKYKVTGIVSTGLSNKHFLVPEYQLKPILTYFKGLTPTGNVFIHNDCFDDESEAIIDRDASDRIQKLAHEMIYLQRGINNR